MDRQHVCGLLFIGEQSERTKLSERGIFLYLALPCRTHIRDSKYV